MLSFIAFWFVWTVGLCVCCGVVGAIGYVAIDKQRRAKVRVVWSLYNAMVKRQESSEQQQTNFIRELEKRRKHSSEPISRIKMKKP